LSSSSEGVKRDAGGSILLGVVATATRKKQIAQAKIVDTKYAKSYGPLRLKS